MSAPACCCRCGAAAPGEVAGFFRARQAPAAGFFPPIGHHSGWNATGDTDEIGLPRALLVCPTCSGPAETFRPETFQRTPATSPQDVGEDLTAIVLNLRTQVGTLERQLSDANERARAYKERATKAEDLVRRLAAGSLVGRELLALRALLGAT